MDWKQQGDMGQQMPNRGGGGWNDPGMGGAQQGGEMGQQAEGDEDRLKPLREAAAGIDPREAKAQVERMVASGKAPKALVDALYAGARAMLA